MTRFHRQYGLLMALFLSPLSVAAQQPTVKPRPEAPQRLPAPQDVRVRQTGPAELTLTWDAVPGATHYNVGRAVGNGGFQRVADGVNLRLPRYVDLYAPPGARVVYTVTPIADGMAGTRATSEPFTDWQSVGPPLGPPRGVDASLYGGDQIAGRWVAAIGATHYEVRLVPEGGAPSGFNWATTSPGIYVRTPGPGRYALDVRSVARGANGVVQYSDPVRTPVVPVPSASAGSAPAETPSAFAPAEVAVRHTAPVSLRVQGQSAPQGAASWSSLAPAVATVSSDGTITGRASGTTHVVGITGSGSAIRVVVIQVTVTP